MDPQTDLDFTLSADMDRVLVCPVCGHFNTVGSAWCADCRLSLSGTELVSQQEAHESASRRQTALKRRRLVRYGLIGLIVAAVVAWIGYVNLDPFLSLDPPVSTIGAEPGPGEWAMFRRDPAHTGSDVYGGVAPAPDVVWRFRGDAPIRSSPVVVDGYVYIGTGDHRVVALDAESGDIVWERTVTGPVDWPVAAAGDLVFIGLRDARVLALDRYTGDMRWEFRASGPIHGSSAVQRGELYIGSDDFGIYALDAMTGEERWVYRTGGRVASSVAVNADVITVTSEDKYLYVIDRSTGRPRLDFRLTTGSRSPVLFDSIALVIDGRGRLTAIDWRQDDKPFEKFVTWAGLQLFAWGILDEVPTQRGFVWSFRPNASGLVGEPAAAAGRVYVSGSMGALYALDVETGLPVWEFRAESALEHSPSVRDRVVYVVDSGGRLYAVDAETGESQWEFDIGDQITTSPVVAGGALYIVSEDGGLLAMR